MSERARALLDARSGSGGGVLLGASLGASLDAVLGVTLGLGGLLAGLALLGLSLVAFPALVLLSALSPAVSGAWLVVPTLMGVAGVGLVGVWVVAGEGALRDHRATAPASPQPATDLLLARR